MPEEATPTVHKIFAEPIRRSHPTREMHFAEPPGSRDEWQSAKAAARNGDRKTWLGPFTDMLTGESVLLRPAPCGLGCYCAAEWKKA